MIFINRINLIFSFASRCKTFWREPYERRFIPMVPYYKIYCDTQNNDDSKRSFSLLKNILLPFN